MGNWKPVEARSPLSKFPPPITDAGEVHCRPPGVAKLKSMKRRRKKVKTDGALACFISSSCMLKIDLVWTNLYQDANSSQGQPWSLNHFNISRSPLMAALKRWVFQEQPSSNANFKNHDSSNFRNSLTPRAFSSSTLGVPHLLLLVKQNTLILQEYSFFLNNLFIWLYLQ